MVLNKLFLDYNHFKGPGFRNIEEVLKSVLWRVTELSLTHCFLYDPEVVVLANGIKENFFLEILNLSHNAIQSLGILSLAEALSSSSKLISLDLSHNQISVRVLLE